MDTKLWVAWDVVRGADGQCCRDLYAETNFGWMGWPEATPNNFVLSSLCSEIYRLIKLKRHSIPPAIPPNVSVNFILELVSTATTGFVYALYLSSDEFPGSNPMEITDEELLEKLRSVNGQLDYGGVPVVYHEHLLEKLRNVNGQFIFSGLPATGGQ